MQPSTRANSSCNFGVLTTPELQDRVTQATKVELFGAVSRATIAKVRSAPSNNVEARKAQMVAASHLETITTKKERRLADLARKMDQKVITDFQNQVRVVEQMEEVATAGGSPQEQMHQVVAIATKGLSARARELAHKHVDSLPSLELETPGRPADSISNEIEEEKSKARFGMALTKFVYTNFDRLPDDDWIKQSILELPALTGNSITKAALYEALSELANSKPTHPIIYHIKYSAKLRF